MTRSPDDRLAALMPQPGYSGRIAFPRHHSVTAAEETKTVSAPSEGRAPTPPSL
jgi:hypothetical protein